jgi:hypothetical protein
MHSNQNGWEDDSRELELRKRLERESGWTETLRKRAENPAVQLERERLKRLEQPRLEQERLEQQRLEQEQLESEQLESERLEQERLVRFSRNSCHPSRLEQERLEQERLEQERLEQERLEQERLEQERLEQERLEQERLVQELKAERLEESRRSTRLILKYGLGTILIFVLAAVFMPLWMAGLLASAWILYLMGWTKLPVVATLLVGFVGIVNLPSRDIFWYMDQPETYGQSEGEYESNEADLQYTSEAYGQSEGEYESNEADLQYTLAREARERGDKASASDARESAAESWERWNNTNPEEQRAFLEDYAEKVNAGKRPPKLEDWIDQRQ